MVLFQGILFSNFRVFSSMAKQFRRPTWLKTPLPSGSRFLKLKSLTRRYRLNTVCESASCPNVGKCWNTGTLTIMILGDICTRACRFCDVTTGKPVNPRPEEPLETAIVLSQLDLNYAVVTSVDRDDLPDGGATHWARTLREIRRLCPGLKLEALIPDFRGDSKAMNKVFRERPDVLSHNIESVPSLQAIVRPQCRYEWSLETIKKAHQYGLVVKSGIMLGHGETRIEVEQTLRDLVDAGCQILSIGQYLQPSLTHLPVVEFIPPETFLEYKKFGESLGFAHVESGPLVRSSFKADEQARLAGI